MPVNLTDVDAFTIVAAPIAGEARTAASVTQGLQPLANRTRRLLNAVVGALLNDGRLRVGAVTAGIGVYVGPIKACVIGERVLTQAAEAEVPGVLPFTFGAWYYVYASDVAGVLTLQASLDVPDVSMAWRSTGLLTHRYLGAFRTDGAGAPIPMNAVRGVYQWANALPTREVLAAGAAIAPTTVVCSAWAPPHARWLRLRLRTLDTVATARTSSIMPVGGPVIEQGECTASGVGVHVTEIPCDGAQSFDYLVSSVDARLKINVHGWRE